MTSKQGEKVGHKGVSQRKPKKSKSFSNDNLNGNTRPGASPSVRSLVKDSGAALNRGGAYPAAGSNKKNRKGK